MNKHVEQFVADLLVEMMPDALEIVKKQMMTEFAADSFVNDHGKISGWQQDIANALQMRDIKYSNGVVSATVYLPHGHNEARASVIFDGNPGIGQPPLFTKPDQQTWDSNMEQYAVHTHELRNMPDDFRRGPVISGGEQAFLHNVKLKAEDKISDYFEKAISPIAEQIARVVTSSMKEK